MRTILNNKEIIAVVGSGLCKCAEYDPQFGVEMPGKSAIEVKNNADCIAKCCSGSSPLMLIYYFNERRNICPTKSAGSLLDFVKGFS